MSNYDNWKTTDPRDSEYDPYDGDEDEDEVEEDNSSEED